MKSKSEKELLEGEIALQKAAMRTVRTLLEGERLGYNNALSWALEQGEEGGKQMNVNQFTPEELAKLPKWALQKIEMLESERRTAVDALRRYTDEQTGSPFRVTELECIGEQVGPTFITRYIQAYKMEIVWKGVELTVITKDDGIFLSWATNSQSVREFVGLVPTAFQQATLRAEASE